MCSVCTTSSPPSAITQWPAIPPKTQNLSPLYISLPSQRTVSATTQANSKFLWETYFSQKCFLSWINKNKIKSVKGTDTYSGKRGQMLNGP